MSRHRPTDPQSTEVVVTRRTPRPRRVIAVPLWVVLTVGTLIFGTLGLLIYAGQQQSDFLSEGRRQRNEAIAQLREEFRVSQCRLLLIRPDQTDPTVVDLERSLRCSVDDLPVGTPPAAGAPTSPRPPASPTSLPT